MTTNSKVDRVLLGMGLALLAAFTGMVVWMYFGERAEVPVEFDRASASGRAKLSERSVRKCQLL